MIALNPAVYIPSLIVSDIILRLQGLLGGGDCPKLDATCMDVAPWLKLLRVWRFLAVDAASESTANASSNNAIQVQAARAQ